MTDIDRHIEKQLEKLQSPKASIRYEACEFLHASPIITPKAIQSLQKALADPDPSVTEAARRALHLHLAPEPSQNAKEQVKPGSSGISELSSEPKIRIPEVLEAIVILLDNILD